MQRHRKRQMQEIVAEVCRLLETPGEVRSVHIVTSARPTCPELRRYQKSARGNHVRLNVDGDGVIAVRPHETDKER
jgi:hypothetical protein